jgi:hypothetical protein
MLGISGSRGIPVIRPLAATLAAMIVTAGLAAPVHADTISISGTLEGNSTLTPTGTSGIFAQNFTGDGDDTTFGSFTSQSQSTVDFTHPPSILVSDGSFTETFAQGTLFGTNSGDGTASGHGTATVTFDLVFTGGTGLFAGAAGEATATETIRNTGPTTESITGSYTGTLTTTPLPATWMMLLAGLIGLGFFARRGTTEGSAAIAAA